jgi:serine/threonine-protein kinase HipA
MKLDVWMESCPEPIGQLVRAKDKSLTFIYSGQVPDDGRISMAMPIRETPYSDADCVAFFGNLLFEGRELDRIVKVHGIDRDDIGGLLYHLGTDCPGAVSITPEGTGPGKRPGKFPEDYEEIAPEKLAKTVQSLHFKGQLPDGSRDPSPVAGVQPKIAVVHLDGKFYLPVEDIRAPTTHILKVSPRADPQLTRYEDLLLAFARSVGINTTHSERMVFEDEETSSSIETILSTRFDRRLSEVEDKVIIRRVHSEDFCQALGLARELKYERDADLEHRKFCLAAIGNLSENVGRPIEFKMEFLRHLIFNLFVGNTDNHGKNAAILYNSQSGDLAPLYDVVPVFIDTKVTHKFSFLLGDAEFAEDLTPENFKQAIRHLGFRGKKLPKQILGLITAIGSKLPDFLENAECKNLADAVATQISVVSEATQWDAPENHRDFHPRQTRDDDPVVHGWPGLD